ncbi:MAG TPA: succinyl-diaminopimelate desuccinylase [Steroidobacteraceae bacterium]|nr:succinyl-diaminopimelate desuccinylase [Steroidobacteraceae bacterium]
MSRTLELTKELIRRRSVTPDDAGCQQLIADRLRSAGFTIEHMRFGDVDNLWAVHHGGEGPLACFAGHTDVVPSGPREKWGSNPFEPVVRDGLLYGRGAADMKSGVAAMVTSAIEYVAARPSYPGSIAFVITSDEEGPSVDGTRRVVDALQSRGQRVAYCIVGEPSSQQAFGDTVRIGRRGSLSGRLTVQGVQGHVAYPERALNPIHAVLPAFAELAARHWDNGDAHFPPTSFQLSNLQSGTGAANVIPGELHAVFNLRWSPVQSVDGLKTVVGAILDRHGLEHRVDWLEASMPYYTAPGTLTAAVTAAVSEECGGVPELSTGGGTSDGRFFGALGAEVVEFGLLNRTIHKVDECCAVEDIDRLHRVYAGALRRIFAG